MNAIAITPTARRSHDRRKPLPQDDATNCDNARHVCAGPSSEASPCRYPLPAGIEANVDFRQRNGTIAGRRGCEDLVVIPCARVGADGDRCILSRHVALLSATTQQMFRRTMDALKVSAWYRFCGCPQHFFTGRKCLSRRHQCNLPTPSIMGATETRRSSSFISSAVSPRYQLIQGIDDLLPFLRERVHHLPELFSGNGNEFQRMQNH